MRARMIVIGRETETRARLAQIATRGGYRVEVAESLAHARRGTLDGVALALFASGRFGAEESVAVEELRSVIGRVLIVTEGGEDRNRRPGHIDISDERGLLERMAEGAGRRLPGRSRRANAQVWQLPARPGLRQPRRPHRTRNSSKSRGVWPVAGSGVAADGFLSRDQLLQLTAGRDAEPYDRSVDMQIARLRRKIEPDLKRPSLIVTVPNSGYKFAATVQMGKPAATAKPDAAESVSDEARRAPERRHITAISIELVPDRGRSGLTTDPEELRDAPSAPSVALQPSFSTDTAA